KRILVQESVYNRFLDILMERVAKIRMGDPLLEETDLGAVISPQAVAKAQEQVRRSLEMGARCLTGGESVASSYHQPTVLVDVTPEMPVMCDEVFGPVAPIYTFN